MSYYLKSPGGQLDYSIDWAAGYLDTQSVASSYWTITPVEAGGLAVLADTRSAARVTATLTGGVVGHVYAVSNRAIFTDGRIDERTISVRVEAR
jgi:hypothetical protein